MYNNGGDPTHIMKDLSLEQIDDAAELEKIIKKIMKESKQQVEQYKSGKENVLQYFVGQAMSATKGKANPKIAVEILKQNLK